MISVPLNGDTVFAPLNEIVEILPPAKRNEWERLWMMTDQLTGPIHPLIYPHPITQQKVKFLMWIFIVSCVLTVFEALHLKDFETYKEYTINKASLFLRTSEKSSQFPLLVTYSTEVSSFCIISPKYTDEFAPSSHKFNISVMKEIGCWQVIKHVHHFIAQRKNAVVQFMPLKQHLAGHRF